MSIYKTDFEEERRDRVSAHSKMADMENQIVQLTGRSGHELATYKHEVDELKRDKQAVQDELRKKHQELESVTAELKKHQTILADLEIVHKKCVEESNKEVANLKVKAEAATSELQAKASQVKQYAKENDTLKKEIQQLKQQVTVLYV